MAGETRDAKPRQPALERGTTRAMRPAERSRPDTQRAHQARSPSQFENAGAIPAPWKNCKQVNASYPHGIGKLGAHDKASGTPPVTNFKRSTRLYLLAMSHDGDLLVAWPTLTVPEKRRLMHGLLEQVVVTWAEGRGRHANPIAERTEIILRGSTHP